MNSLFETGRFFTGCNYFASHAGINMWRNWDETVVRKDLALLKNNHLDVLRVFPMWHDFQPLKRMCDGGGGAREFRSASGAVVEPSAGLDEVMLARFDRLCELAEAESIQLVVGLLTGWMSGRVFMPDAFLGRNPLTDPEVIRFEIRFIHDFVTQFRSRKAIAAWDLGNECNCMGLISSANEAWLWVHSMASAIRLADSDHPVLAGMHSLSSDRRAPWNIAALAEETDVLTTHPYPLFTPNCNREPLNTMRNILHGPAESLFYQGVGGKTCFAEEEGSLGPMMASSERTAQFLEASLFSHWSHNLPGVLWWDAFDATHLDYPPYEWNALERELGLFTADSQPKAMVDAFEKFAELIEALPFRTLPPHQVDAVCLIPENCDGFAAGFGAFLLAKQAKFDLAFAGLNQPLPEADFYLLPSLNTPENISRSQWSALRERVRNGATLLTSFGRGAMVSEFQEFFGVEVESCYQEQHPGIISMNDFPAAYLRCELDFRRTLIVHNAEVLATDESGNPALTMSHYGLGHAFFLNLPLETMAVSVVGGCLHGGASLNPLYLLYRAVAQRCHLHRLVAIENPEIGVTEHFLDEKNSIAVLVNYSASAIKEPISVAGSFSQHWGGIVANGTVSMAPNSVVILKIARTQGGRIIR